MATAGISAGSVPAFNSKQGTPSIMDRSKATCLARSVSRTARLRGTELSLTSREFDLLHFLLQHPGQVFGRAEMMERVWGWTFGDRSTVTVHVRRLREKIEPDPARPTRIVTVWGVGYRLDPGSPAGSTAASEQRGAGRST